MTTPPEILRLSDVMRRTTLSKSQIYNMIRDDEFPPPFKLTHGANAWVAEHINTWLADRIAADTTESGGAK